MLLYGTLLEDHLIVLSSKTNTLQNIKNLQLTLVQFSSERYYRRAYSLKLETFDSKYYWPSKISSTFMKWPQSRDMFQAILLFLVITKNGLERNLCTWLGREYFRKTFSRHHFPSYDVKGKISSSFFFLEASFSSTKKNTDLKKQMLQNDSVRQSVFFLEKSGFQLEASRFFFLRGIS